MLPRQASTMGSAAQVEEELAAVVVVVAAETVLATASRSAAENRMARIDDLDGN